MIPDFSSICGPKDPNAATSRRTPNPIVPSRETDVAVKMDLLLPPNTMSPPAPSPPASASPSAGGWGWAVIEVGFIFVMFFVFAGAPPPDVGEAHYLAKAKHYWDPAWCRGDMFLESKD